MLLRRAYECITYLDHCVEHVTKLHDLHGTALEGDSGNTVNEHHASGQCSHWCDVLFSLLSHWDDHVHSSACHPPLASVHMHCWLQTIKVLSACDMHAKGAFNVWVIAPHGNCWEH